MEATFTEEEPPLEKWAFKKANWPAFQHECLIQLTEDLVTPDITQSYVITSLANIHILHNKPIPLKRKFSFGTMNIQMQFKIETGQKIICKP